MMLNVLLISPLPKIDPACGDVVYTETLLSHPPENVVYETYAQALKRGTLREHATTLAFKQAARERHQVFREAGRVVMQKASNLLRRHRWMFWEPFRCFSVAPDVYDLIHVHVFSTRLLNLPCPLLVSNAAPARSLYEDGRRYAKWRVRAMEAADRSVGRLGGVNVTSYALPQASRVISFTEYLRDWYVSRRIMPADRIDVVPIYLPSPPNVAPSACARPVPRQVGFIAKDFDAKGGVVLLRAFARVRERRPYAELVIVGCPPRLNQAECATRGIRWIPYVPREQLMRDILPSFDVFAYPTEFDGMPLVVLEALSLGVPVATSDYQAMPELVDRGRVGRVSAVGDADALAQNVIELLDPQTNQDARRAARSWFGQTYAADAVRPRLREAYERAIESPRDFRVKRVQTC